MLPNTKVVLGNIYDISSRNYKVSYYCLVNPILSRESDEVRFSFDGIEKGLKNMIFQKRINTYRLIGVENRYVFPIIGIYINNSTSYGIFTRIGDMVTDFNAMFVPTFIE